MILGSWPSAAARALANILAESGSISEVVEVEPHEAQKSLLEGRVDLPLIPTFDVLRAEDVFDLLPGIGLVGDRSPSQVLVISSPLDQISSVAFDPHFAQEVLLSQIILKENYKGTPTFSAVNPSMPVSERLATYDAALVPSSEAPPDGVVLDLGQEWLELTLRPMVWGLLAGRKGEIEVETARQIQKSVQEASPPDAARGVDEGGYQFTLDGYALDGLDELTQYFFSHGSLTDFPELPFIEIPELV